MENAMPASTGPVYHSRISLDEGGDLAAAVTSRAIRVLALAGYAGAAGATITLTSVDADDNATDITGTMILAANAPLTWPENLEGWCESFRGDKLAMALTGAFDGVLVYQEVDSSLLTTTTTTTTTEAPTTTTEEPTTTTAAG